MDKAELGHFLQAQLVLCFLGAFMRTRLKDLRKLMRCLFQAFDADLDKNNQASRALLCHYWPLDSLTDSSSNKLNMGKPHKFHECLP